MNCLQIIVGKAPEKILRKETTSERLKLTCLSLGTFHLSLAENIKGLLMRNTGTIMLYLPWVCLLPVMFLAHKYFILLICSAEYSSGLIHGLYNHMVPSGIYNILMLRNVYILLSSYKWQMLPAFFPHLNCALVMSILKCLLSIEIFIPVWNFYETWAHGWPSLHEFWHYPTMNTS